MAHTLKWLVDKRLLLLYYKGAVDKAELDAVNNELAILLSEGEAPVHIISDNREMTSLPFDIKTLQGSIGVLRDEKWGMAFIIGADTMLRYFGQLVSSSFRLNLRLVKSMDEVRTILMEHDESLPSRW